MALFGYGHIEIQSQPDKNSSALYIANGIMIGNRGLFYIFYWIILLCNPNGGSYNKIQHVVIPDLYLVQYYLSIKYIQSLCFSILNMRKDVSSHLPHKYLEHFHLYNYLTYFARKKI